MLPGTHNNIEEVLAKNRRQMTRMMIVAVIALSAVLGLLLTSIYELCH